MLMISLEDAKENLAQLVDRAAESGAGFIITKQGKPMVKVSAIGVEPVKAGKRIGFMAGRANVPDDFNAMMADEIAEMFSPDAP